MSDRNVIGRSRDDRRVRYAPPPIVDDPTSAQGRLRVEDAETHMVSQMLVVPFLGLSSVAKTVAQQFLFFAADTSIYDAFLGFDATSRLSGEMHVEILTRVDAVKVELLSAATIISKPTVEPYRLRLNGTQLRFSRPVFLRFTTFPAASLTPWWETEVTEIYLTLHLRNAIRK